MRGKIPCYDEVFLDEGDIDMLGALRQLQRLEFDGVLIPDHTPLIDGKAPWENGYGLCAGLYARGVSGAWHRLTGGENHVGWY